VKMVLPAALAASILKSPLYREFCVVNILVDCLLRAGGVRCSKYTVL
jgi:hypothetical protein